MPQLTPMHNHRSNHRRSRSHSCPRSRSRHTGTPLHLTIPSLHDSTALETSLHVPAAPTSKAAVLAHPFTPLGGNFHDPVVELLTSALVSRGWIVGVFNFRGAGNSKGRTSWTGKPEVSDFAAVAAWVLCFAFSLPRLDRTAPPEEVELILGGYSYGALIASQTDISALKTALSHPPSAPFRDSVLAGAHMARRWWDSHSGTPRTSYSGVREVAPPTASPLHVPASPVTQGQSSSAPLQGQVYEKSPDLDLKRVKVKTRYLLVSPPLPPVSFFLFPLGSGTETVMGAEVAKKRDIEKMLAVWGDEDIFTGAKRYRRWGEKMEQGIGEKWMACEINGQGHFYEEDGLKLLERAVSAWVQETQ